jgi:hypothetical protein
MADMARTPISTIAPATAPYLQSLLSRKPNIILP